MVVTCMMTLVTRIGPEHQKGAITGIFRSLGALARACGPIVASSGESKCMKLLLLHEFRFPEHIHSYFQRFGALEVPQRI